MIENLRDLLSQWYDGDDSNELVEKIRTVAHMINPAELPEDLREDMELLEGLDSLRAPEQPSLIIQQVEAAVKAEKSKRRTRVGMSFWIYFAAAALAMAAVFLPDFLFENNVKGDISANSVASLHEIPAESIRQTEKALTKAARTLETAMDKTAEQLAFANKRVNKSIEMSGKLIKKSINFSIKNRS